MQKLDPEKLPEPVLAAQAGAEAYLQERFRGRRVIPKPVVCQLPIPEVEGVLWAVLMPPGGQARERILLALQQMRKAQERSPAAAAEAIGQAEDLCVVECAYWAWFSGDEPQPAPPKDPQAAARAYLRSLKSEAGTLGAAFGEVAGAAIKLLETPEVSLGKL